VHVAELKQLFNSIDPSPFRNKDLDPKAPEEFIVGWAKDMARDSPLGLVVDLNRSTGLPDEAAILRDSIRESFLHRSNEFRRRLGELFRVPLGNRKKGGKSGNFLDVTSNNPSI
jgi:hypothetical protein